MKKEQENLPVDVHAAGCTSREVTAKVLGRLVALAILLVGAIVVAVGLTACDMDDDNSDEPDRDWYLAGTWENDTYPDESMTFYEDGTGYWMSDISGDFLDFDYYCYGSNIFFTFYPAGAASYNLSSAIYMDGGGSMTIVWPPSSMYGPVTIQYTRIG